MDLALELVHSRPVGEMTLRREAQSQKEIIAARCPAIFGLHDPFRGGFVELSLDNSGVECAIFLDIQLSLDVVEILLKLFRTGVSAGPIPVLPDLRHTVFVARLVGD